MLDVPSTIVTLSQQLGVSVTLASVGYEDIWPVENVVLTFHAEYPDHTRQIEVVLKALGEYIVQDKISGDVLAIDLGYSVQFA